MVVFCMAFVVVVYVLIQFSLVCLFICLWVVFTYKLSLANTTPPTNF